MNLAKLIIQNKISCTFVHNSQLSWEKNYKNKHIYNCHKKIKYLTINLIQDLKALYNKSHKTMMKENKYINIGKMSNEP